jgi:Sec-independent protein translocase protein TatA
MEILGVGPLELFFILLIALIVLGPGDMVKAGRTLGRFLRKIVTSPEWRTVQKASRELRYLPNRLMREANLEDLSKDFSDINKIGGQINDEVKKMEIDLASWTTPPELADNKNNPLNPDQTSPSISDSQENPVKPSDKV